MEEKTEKYEYAQLGGTWRVIHHPALIASTKIIDNGTKPSLLLTQKEDIISLTVAWKPKRDEVNFYFLPDKRVVIINKETFEYIGCFPFLFNRLDKRRMTVECCLSAKVKIRANSAKDEKRSSPQQAKEKT